MRAQHRPTRRQLEVLRAYISAGSIAAAAYELGISETTARQHLSGPYRRMGCVNAAQAAYLMGRDGRDPAIDIAFARDGARSESTQIQMTRPRAPSPGCA